MSVETKFTDFSSFIDHTGVSRETAERFAIMDRILLEWSAHTNLVARSSLEARWHRHYLDSSQLCRLLPEQLSDLADFGSGAGFPGLVLAIMLAERAGAPKVSLVESVSKKARFLEQVAHETGLTNVKVWPNRVEAIHITPRPTVITARAMTALPQLLAYVHQHLSKDGVCLLPKGKNAENELTDARATWDMSVIPHASVTDAEATIFEISALKPRRAR